MTMHGLMDAIPIDHARQSNSRKIAEEAIKRASIKISTIVDLGCGTGRHFDWVNSLGMRYIGLDIEDSPEVRMRPKEVNGNLVTYDGVNLPFKSSTVDMFFSNQVLEHVKEPYLLMPEITRCLKTGGIFAGSVSQLEPYHSHSVLNYTFYGIFSLFCQWGLNVHILRPGIDATTLIRRSFNKFTLKTGSSFEDLFWNEESPLNYSLDILANKNKWNIKKLNLEKLKFSGQVCFAALKL